MGKRVGISKATEKALTKDIATMDGYNNFYAKLGMQTENLSSLGSYTYGSLVSRNHVMLEMIYRTSWIAGQVVDTVAEDMTKEGITMLSKSSPDDTAEIQSKMTELHIWQSICSAIKWSRLYGGSIAVILTDGADYEKPLDIKKIGKDSFKGLLVFDRWQLDPSLGDLVTELGIDMGKPKYYTIIPAMETMTAIKVHHSRCIRLDGIEMPYYQKKIDNLWGMSVIERMMDRLVAFDSATQGAAQLLYKAYLRVVQIDGLRAALAMGGKTEQAVIKQFQYIRLMQTNEGITLLDSKDTFSAHNYSFGGVADVLREFSQQISGAVNIPLVRLFGQSPSGFSTGDTDLRNYYDGIKKKQEAVLRSDMRKILEVMSMSVHGRELPDDFEFEFKSLWSISEVEKSQIASNDVNSNTAALQSGITTQKIAMKELAQQSRITGRFTNITDEDIQKAKEGAPEPFGGFPPENKEEEKVEAKSNHEISTEELEKQLNDIGNEPEEDESVKEEIDLETLSKELEKITETSLEHLENELNRLNEPSLNELEKQLNSFSSGSMSLEQLDEELKKLNLSDNTIQLLEQQLNELTPPKVPKKMTADDIGVGNLLVRAWRSLTR